MLRHNDNMEQWSEETMERGRWEGMHVSRAEGGLCASLSLSLSLSLSVCVCVCVCMCLCVSLPPSLPPFLHLTSRVSCVQAYQGRILMTPSTTNTKAFVCLKKRCTTNTKLAVYLQPQQPLPQQPLPRTIPRTWARTETPARYRTTCLLAETHTHTYTHTHIHTYTCLRKPPPGAYQGHIQTKPCSKSTSASVCLKKRCTTNTKVAV